MKKKNGLATRKMGIGMTALLLICGACKKEYIDKVNRVLDDGFIESFALLSEFHKDTVIQASIVGDEIIVYWPAYKELPASISPKIGTSEKASISPASETSVPFQNGTKYKVKSESGKEKEYTLKVDLRQPIPVIFHNMHFKNVAQGSVKAITGYWILRDAAKTKIFLVSKDNPEQEYELQLVDFGLERRYIYTAPRTVITHDVPPGDYHTKFVNGLHTVYATIRNKDERHVTTVKEKPRDRARYLSDLNTLPITLKRGDELVIYGACFDHLQKVSLLKTRTSGDKHELELVRSSYAEWVGKIPSDIPLDTYEAYQLTSSDGTIITQNHSSALTIEE